MFLNAIIKWIEKDWRKRLIYINNLMEANSIVRKYYLINSDIVINLNQEILK